MLLLLNGHGDPSFLLGLAWESPSHKMQPISSPKGGSWSQAFHAQTAETGDENATARVLSCAGLMRWRFALCFVKKVLQRFMSSTLMSHT